MAPFRQQFANPDDTTHDAEEVRTERAFGGVTTATPGSAAARGAEMRAAMLAKLDGTDDGDDKPDPPGPPTPA